MTHDTLEEYARRSGVQMIVWKDFPTKPRQIWSTFPRPEGFSRIASFPGTRVPLRGASFDDYVAALKIPSGIGCEETSAAGVRRAL